MVTVKDASLLAGPRHRPEPNPDRNTLKVYWFLLLQPSSRATLREVQRAMGFQSPNAAIFHLDKLSEMGLVDRTRDGIYRECERRKFGQMDWFVMVGHVLIPKPAVYAGVMSASMVVSALLLLPFMSLPTALALAPGLLSIVILWHQALVVWRQRPRFVSRV